MTEFEKWLEERKESHKGREDDFKEDGEFDPAVAHARMATAYALCIEKLREDPLLSRAELMKEALERSPLTGTLSPGGSIQAKCFWCKEEAVLEQKPGSKYGRQWKEFHKPDCLRQRALGLDGGNNATHE
jgi:hypothetical protein